MTTESGPGTTLAVLTVAALAVVVGLVVGVGLWQSTADHPGDLTREWVSDTATEYDGNHHDIAVATVDGEPVVGIPRSDLDGSERCGLVALDGSGDVAWQHPFPPEHCTPHAIGDVTVGSLTGDDPEFFAATEQETVLGVDAGTGTQTFEHETTSLGFSAPVVADLTGDGRRELAVVDFSGLVQVVRPDGTTRWSTDVGRSVLVDPVAADVTGDGATELVVSSRPEESRGGAIAVFDATGTRLWNATLERPATSVSSVSGAASAGATGPETRLVVSTRDGTVVGFDASGERAWSRSLEDRGTVGAATGETAYLSTVDGSVHALDVTDGSIRWTRSVAGDVQQLAPPVLGDATGDGTREVAVTGSDGTVAVLDGDGDVLASHDAGEPIHVAPALVDVTGDGTPEVLVLYGDGRVAAYSFELS